jgi:hypothetical protein
LNLLRNTQQQSITPCAEKLKAQDHQHLHALRVRTYQKCFRTQDR